jgi:hypothetical protein
VDGQQLATRQRPVAVRHRLDGTEPQVCPSCGGASHTLAAEAHAAYAYLLGVYLGDGCISEAARRVSLRVSLDIAYPGIIEEVQAAIGCVLSSKCASAWRRPGENVVVLTAYSRAWLCLFPQHGPGRKHERAIRLAQ